MALTSEELERTYTMLVQASCPEDVFGEIKNALSEREKLDSVHSLFRQLSRLVHPDLYKDPRINHMANEAFKELNRLQDEANSRIKSGVYGKPVYTPSQTKSTATIVVGGRTYTIFTDSIGGDFCQILTAEYTDERGNTVPVCLKMPFAASDNDLMQNEAEALRVVSHKSLPVLIDSFIYQGKVVNVLRRISLGYDLVTVRKHFFAGLPQEHVVWIMDRLLSVFGFIHISGVIHGAFEPGNCVITPNNHNGILLDFLLAVMNATSSTAAYKGKNAFSAPELSRSNRPHPHPSADMYSLGATMVYLLGGDYLTHTYPSSVDPRFKRFLESFLVTNPENRKGDAWGAWHELHELRRDIFGASNQFLPLHL